MLSSFLTTLYLQLIAFSLIIAILAMFYFILIKLIAPRIESDRKRHRFKTRVIYILTFIFIVLTIRIWVKGFNTIFTVLSVVTAALVITHKETIMNFTGWLIIQWRELFTEGDYIQIQNYNGKVRSIGLLYITLMEFIANSERIATGRIIRIPNGVVVNSPIINYSQTSHLLAYQAIIVVTNDSNFLLAMQLTQDTVSAVLANFYANRREYTKHYLLSKNKKHFSMLNMDPLIDLKLQYDKPFGLKLTVHYYCYACDHEAIEQKIWLTLLPLLQQQTAVKLSSST